MNLLTSMIHEFRGSHKEGLFMFVDIDMILRIFVNQCL